MNKIKYRTGRLLVQLGNSVAWFRNQKMQAVGLTSSQSEVMRYVLRHREERITAGDLMTQLNLSQSTVAGIIKRLEKKSLVARHTDDLDARKSVIVPTEEGAEFEQYLKEIAARTEEVLLRGMTEEEQAEFNRLLKIALDNMNESRDSRGGKDGRKSGVSGGYGKACIPAGDAVCLCPVCTGIRGYGR